MEKKKNVPVLRFPEFSGDWEKKKLGDISEKINSGKTPLGGESVYTEQGILFIRSQNVFDNKLSYENSTFIPEEINNTMKNSIVKPKDILLNITGASLGRSCVLPENFTTGNVNQHVCIVRIDKNNEPLFIQPIFASEKGQNLFISLQTGSGREGLNFQNISKISFYYPTHLEQQKVASFLLTVENKLQALKKKKTLLEQYKKGMMQKIFSQELRFKDDSGAAFPKWEKKKLGEVVKLENRKYNPEKENNSVKCIELEHLASETGQILGFVDGKNSGSIKNRFKKGDVLFGKLRPYLKKYLFAPFDGVCSSEIWVLTGKQITNEFLYFIVQSNKFIDLTSISSGSKMPRADWNIVSDGLFNIPSLPEQTKIANFLSAIDDKINLCNTQIEKTEQWKKGLLQKMFV